ncbi:hypothetical protein Tco_1383359 [Tanacetum coccineum]
MLAIFHDMIEESVEVFMDDFSVFENSFETCLNNLDKMLQRCKDAHLVLNWEKCHFIVKEGILLGHKVSSAGLEVEKAKIDVISKLLPPTNIKGVRSFLGHADFYRRFIKDFSKIARPLTKLLEKDTPFELDDEFGAVLEFDIEIKDRKGTENVAADHLSRIENDESSNDSGVDDNFPGEILMEINTKDEPWFAYFANYLVGDIISKGMTYQQKNKFFSDLKHYFWEESYLFKICSDGMIRSCLSGLETRTILDQCRHRPTGGHYGPNITAKKVLDSGFYLPKIIKESHTLVRLCKACQKTGNISKRDEMPLNNIQAANIDQSPLHEMSIQDMEDLKQHYLDEMLSLSNDLQIKDYRNEKLDIHFKRECESMIDELKESTIPLNEIISQIPPSIAITPILPTLEPEDSLIMGNEELNTIPEKESNEVIKSSVENLVPILSEFEDTSESDSDCDLPSCDDFSPINVSKEKFVTFSNPLFDSNDDFTSSDDESLSDEDVPEDNVKIYSNPLFEFDDVYISSDVNPLFDEVLENIESKNSDVSNFDEPALLVTPLSDANKDECFNPGGNVDEIKFLLHRDPSTPKLSVASILEGFIDEPPLEENDDLFDLESKENEWKKILYDAPIDDLMTEDKVFDPGIHEKFFSPTYVSLPFEDRHYLSFTYVIRIFLPYFTYPVDSSLPLSSGSEDIIFDPDISAFHFSSLEPVAYKCPMEDCPDYEDSRARGFVHRSLDLQSLACLFMGIRYPRSY